MYGKILARLLILLALVFVGAAYAANDPTLHEVYQAAESGRLNEAQAMMDKVLRDHPNSGKAHFVEAELMVKQGRIAAAQGELATAERLAPGLPFVKPEAVQSLKARLSNNRVQAPVAQYAQPAQAPASSGFPWGMVLIGGALLAAVIFFVRSLSNRNNVTVVPAGYGAAGGTYGGGGFGPGPVMQPGGGGMAAPMGGVGGGMGSGILGGLATGAAVGAGMVAGEALMHRVLDGGHHDSNAIPNPAPTYVDRPDTSSYDMGGNDFGVSDGGSWDDSGSSGGGDDWT
jgi:hypothetical protein